VGTLVTLAQACALREALRQEHKQVVFTNGVFDILHVGHVRYLQAASGLGDALMVGLNSDASASHLKGPGRPLVFQAERAEILCALSCVDHVIIFNERTAEAVVEALRPDVYVKGGDYSDGKPLPEARVATRHGGRVVILPYTPGRSTTDTIALLFGPADLDRGA
jgi:rfaE bifunctional protein nucleotidyltransferase chain/domain